MAHPTHFTRKGLTWLYKYKSRNMVTLLFPPGLPVALWPGCHQPTDRAGGPRAGPAEPHQPRFPSAFWKPSRGNKENENKSFLEKLGNGYGLSIPNWVKGCQGPLSHQEEEGTEGEALSGRMTLGRSR